MDSGNKFLEIGLNGNNLVDIEPTPRANSVIIALNDGRRIVFQKRAFSQLLKLMDLKVVSTRKWMKENPGEVINLIKTWLRNNEVYLGVVRSEDNTLYCYRVTSEKYTPIPHRILYEFVEKILREKGFKINYRPLVFLRRKGRFYQLYREVIDGEEVRIGVLVTNANIGDKAIHLTLLMFLQKSPYPMNVEKTIRVIHRAKLETILENVGRNLLELITWLKTNHPVIVERLRKTKEIKIDRRFIEEFLERTLVKLPRKYHDWLKRILESNLAKYNRSLYAVYKTLAYFVGVTYKTPSIQEIFYRITREVSSIYRTSSLYI